MNPQIVLWSIVSALAGFLFGFDTVVISGAERTIQALWGLSPWLHGVAMAAALYGTVAGSLVDEGRRSRVTTGPAVCYHRHSRGVRC